jgi:uncharacterized lipoprotein NlpE involved in copper resistance
LCQLTKQYFYLYSSGIWELSQRGEAIYEITNGYQYTNGYEYDK